MCSKCDEHQLIRSGAYIGENWTGLINDVRTWYDVGLAKMILAKCPPIDVALLEEYSVAELWENQVRHSETVEGHIGHVDMAVPILVATIGTADDGRDICQLIDGLHRVTRAHREGIATIKGIHLSHAFSRGLIIDPEIAVLNEVAEELLASGGRMVEIETERGKRLAVVGGSLRPQNGFDHPERLKYLSKRGPIVLPYAVKGAN